MGWKNIKDHYRIEHIVQIRQGHIGIGTGYIHDLIRISFDGTFSWGSLGPSNNDDLARIFNEFQADPATLKTLLDTPDTFEKSLTVWTYSGGEILEKRCEEYGWPNCTHDGLVMYDNVFSADLPTVVEFAMRNAWAGIQLGMRRIDEIKADLQKMAECVKEDSAHFAKLESDYPDIRIVMDPP